MVQVPDGANALRLAGSDGVEIANSDRLVDLRRPFTVELWTKLTPGSTRHWLAGNLVFLPPSPGDTEVVPAGWQWWLEETATGRWRISLTTRIGFFVDVNFDPARWHHLAVCGDGEQLYLFLDGELVGRKPAELLLGGWTESPLNLHLSAHARMLPQQRGGLNGDVRWARLSSTDRYTTNFVPETELASDAETLALFDFERIEGPTVVDRSGNARDGKLTGSLRVVAAGYPPAMDATASKPDTTDVATAAPTPANPATMPNDPAGASPLTPKSPPARAEVPNSDDLREATRKAREVFAAEIEAAKTIVQKAALAQKLVATARDSGDDSVARYALLELAREYEVQAGRLPQVFAIVDEVAAGFEVEPLAAKVESLKELSAPNAKVPIAPPVLAKAAMALTEQAVIQGQFDLASETARLAYAAANRGKDNALKTLARVRRDELNALKRNWELAQAAREKLDTAPDDPQWNLTWGKFLALQQREWAAAAPFLVKSGDEVWRPIGDAETASPQQAAEQRKLGDMLWEAAQDAAKRERDSLLIRARHWYTQAQPQLGGLELAALDKRIEELDAQLPLDWASAASSGEVIGGILPPGPMPAARYIGLLGRISVDGADAAAQMRYRNGFVIGDAKIRDLLAGFGKPAGRLQLEFHGMLHVPENMTVLVRHQGGSDQGGLHSLYLNGRKLGDVGGENLTKNEIYRLELEPGEYAIRWVLTGGDLGSSSVLFANSQTAEPLVLYHTPVMLAAMRRLPTRFAVDMT
ncbi:MAG: hypothetical protein KDA41_13445, partial [Planctomycetales bacterium]|nr:hypothetical protein [Planctomycetales bacterium]